MALQPTDKTRQALQNVSIDPNLVLIIDGIETIFSVISAKKCIRIGDPGLFIDGTWVIGGKRAVDDQKNYLDLSSSSSTIRQQLRADKGSVNSVSTIEVSLVDKNAEISRIISPGVEITEPLGNKAELYMGFRDTSYPEDYFRIFSGVISEIKSGAGNIKLVISHPEEKKRQEIYTKVETEIDEDIGSGATPTTIDLVDASNLIPSTIDEVKSYVIINGEYFRYTGVSSNSITGVTRAQLTAEGGSSATSHTTGDPVTSFYIFEDDAVAMALKLMLSGGPSPFVSSVPIRSFVFSPFPTEVSNAIFFSGENVANKYGIVAGDTISTTGASEAANNLTDSVILNVTSLPDGSSYIIVDDDLDTEASSSAVASLKTKYNVYPEGLRMSPVDVDVKRHEFYANGFLAGTDLKFYIKDTVNGKDFLDQQIYAPLSAFSIPRSDRASVGLLVPPLPAETLVRVTQDNIKNPDKITLRRSLSKNFFNVVVYKYDESLTEDEFLAGTINVDAQSISEIGKRATLNIEARGYRSTSAAKTITATYANRRLNRYKRGAEYLTLDLFFKTGALLEPGDVFIFDPTGLQITNTLDGTRTREVKLFEVSNKTLNLNGTVSIEAVDTNFDGQERFAVVSPSSFVLNGDVNGTTVKESFGRFFDEAGKWEELVGASVVVRKPDYSSSSETVIKSIVDGQINFDPPLSFAPLENDILQLAPYDSQTGLDEVKLIYAFTTDDENDFADGGKPYVIV